MNLSELKKFVEDRIQDEAIELKPYYQGRNNAFKEMLLAIFVLEKKHKGCCFHSKDWHNGNFCRACSAEAQHKYEPSGESMNVIERNPYKPGADF